MRIQLTLDLPREVTSVPLARGMLDSVLASAGVSADCRLDIGLALTEACANVVRHAVGVDSYEVKVTAEEQVCLIDVMDSGSHVDANGLAALPPGPRDEHGRGLRIVKAVMDGAEFVAGPAGGLIVRMIKRLVFAPGPAPSEKSGESAAGADPGRA